MKQKLLKAIELTLNKTFVEAEVSCLEQHMQHLDEVLQKIRTDREARNVPENGSSNRNDNDTQLRT
jgi:hypothetical protein